MSSNNTKAILAIIFTAVIWGLSFVSIKVTIAYIAPITLTLYRFVIATFILFLMIKFTQGTFKIDKVDIPKFAGSGAIGMVIYFYLQNTGMSYVLASEAGIIVASLPIISLILESIINKTKITPLKSILVLISFVGVFIMIGSSGANIGSDNKVLGYILIFISIITWVFYGMASKPLSNKYAQMTIVFYQSLFSIFLLFPLTLLEPKPNMNLSTMVLMNVMYLGIICSAVTFYLYNYAIKHLGVSTTNVYLNLIPIVTVVSSTILLKEAIRLNQIVGGSLVIFSVVYLSFKEKKTINESIIMESVSTNIK